MKRKIHTEGHLIDTGLLRKIMDQIIHVGATYEILRFEIGRTNQDPSEAEIEIDCADPAVLQELLENLTPLGVMPHDLHEVTLEPSPKDGVVPDTFYSTSNHTTEIRHQGHWIRVDKQRMDAVIVVEGDSARCVKLRDVKAGDQVVVGAEGIHVIPPDQERDRAHFGFMNSEVSSEKHVDHVVERLAQDIRAIRAEGRKVLIVPGPVVVHTGGVEPMERLLQAGVIDGLLSGNALAVHDIERALFKTSLGISSETGEGVVDGHRNHMRAINAVRRSGSIPEAVEQGVLTKGIMYACVKHGVPYVLAGSLRDDGPLPEVITDMNEGQEAYGKLLEGAGLVLILSTMLHGIATGNMIPSSVMTVCVDINPAVVTKLSDRGSAQTIGVVTDVGLFLNHLADKLEELEKA